MKRIFPTLIGNPYIKEYIGEDIAKGINSHAYIIEGSEGSGKHTAAALIASALSCENRNSQDHPLPCGVCSNCKKITKGISGDVVYVNRGDKATLGVDVIRGIREGIFVTPNDSDYRTYIIEEADKMTEAAQNALLLTLEEPPSFVVFLLLTEDSSKLLETVRSRAQTVRCQSFLQDEIRSYLSQNDSVSDVIRRNPQKLDDAVAMAGGTIGKALGILLDSSTDSEALQLRIEALNIIPYLCRGRSSELLSAVMSQRSRAGAEVKEILIMIMCAVRDMIAVKKSMSPGLTFYTSIEEAQKLSSETPLRKLITIHDHLYTAVIRLESNVSPKNILCDLALKIARYRR